MKKRRYRGITNVLRRLKHIPYGSLLTKGNYIDIYDRYGWTEHWYQTINKKRERRVAKAKIVEILYDEIKD